MLATPGMTDDDLFGSIDWAIDKLKAVPNWYILFTVFFPLPGSLFHKEIIRDNPHYGFGRLSDLDKIGTKHVSALEWSGISKKYRKKLYRMRAFFKFYGRLYRASLRWRVPFGRLYLRFLERRLRKMRLLNCGFEQWLTFRLFGMLKRLRIIRV